MSDEIKVLVNDYGGGRNLVLLYIDPITGKRKTKSAKTRDPGEAHKEAGKWQAELNAGGGQSPSKITWKEFRQRYKAECLSTLAWRTQETARVALDCVDRVLAPDRLCKLTPTVMSRFQADLRKPREVIKDGEEITLPGMKETTIAKTLRHIKAALRWGERMGMMLKAPKIEMPKRVKGKTMMKGRPITGEEFDRLLATVDKVRPQDAQAWKQYLTGLWLSGLRLEESLVLSWELDSPFMVDLLGRRPVFRIRGEAQKSGRDEILPMTPDFFEWLQATYPETERVGRVFKLFGPGGVLLQPHRVSEIGSKIGKKAGIIVNREGGKFASAHDLRRAFGTRWAPRVKPATLQLLMRHSDIGTTMKYYVAQDAADVADELWAGFATKAEVYNTSYNNQGLEQQTDNPRNDTTPCILRGYESGQGRD